MTPKEMFASRRYREMRNVYGYTVTAAYWSMRRSAHFHAELTKAVEAYNKRSKAAKRGWKTRRAA